MRAYEKKKLFRQICNDLKKQKGLINQPAGHWSPACPSVSAKQMILSGAAHRKV